jgi:hypothetical protein
MARRDRRDVKSRLGQLMAHLLEWEFQPGQRSRNWRATIIRQRQELADLASTGVLRNHAEAALREAYPSAVELATAETGLARDTFPGECPYTVDGLLATDLFHFTFFILNFSFYINDLHVSRFAK